jgi:hypothetical protein
MSSLALFAICFGACLAAALAAYRWIIRPLEQRNREARVHQQRAQRMADINARLHNQQRREDQS